MLNFGLLDKSLGIISPAYFVDDFLTKMFLMLGKTNLIFRFAGPPA